MHYGKYNGVLVCTSKTKGGKVRVKCNLNKIKKVVNASSKSDSRKRDK